jgi:hypothetical protein
MALQAAVAEISPLTAATNLILASRASALPLAEIGGLAGYREKTQEPAEEYEGLGLS